MSDGFSCREQIAAGTPRRALHVAEVARMALAGEERLPARSVARLHPARPLGRGSARAGRSGDGHAWGDRLGGPGVLRGGWPRFVLAAGAAAALALAGLAASVPEGTRGSHEQNDRTLRLGDPGRLHSVGEPRTGAADDQPRDGVFAQRRRHSRARADHLFYADREPIRPYEVVVPPRRTLHLRLNDLDDPAPIPRDTDYSSVIESDVPIVVQHTRLDSRQEAEALLSTVAYSQ